MTIRVIFAINFHYVLTGTLNYHGLTAPPSNEVDASLSTLCPGQQLCSPNRGVFIESPNSRLHPRNCDRSMINECISKITRTPNKFENTYLRARPISNVRLDHLESPLGLAPFIPPTPSYSYYDSMKVATFKTEDVDEGFGNDESEHYKINSTPSPVNRKRQWPTRDEEKFQRSEESSSDSGRSPKKLRKSAVDFSNVDSLH